MSPRRGRESSGAGRTSTFFRGRELLGLVLFTAIAIAGWPLVIAQFRRTQELVPRQLAKPAPDPRPIKPDDGLIFQAIRDKAPSEFRELAAYAELLRRVRETPASELHSDARRDLLFTHFWDRPDAYRGVPVRLEGTVLRTLSYDAKEGLTPKKKLYEAWFITPESRGFPYVAVFEEPPSGFVLSGSLSQPIVFEGYFFKLLGYRAADVPRAAPMLIGRVQLPGASVPPVATGVNAKAERPAWQRPAMIAVVVLCLYASARLFFQVRRFLLRPTLPTRSWPSTPDEDGRTTPDENRVTAFLADLEQAPATDE